MELSWISELNEDSLKLYGLKGIETIDTPYFPKLSLTYIRTQKDKKAKGLIEVARRIND